MFEKKLKLPINKKQRSSKISAPKIKIRKQTRKNGTRPKKTGRLPLRALGIVAMITIAIAVGVAGFFLSDYRLGSEIFLNGQSVGIVGSYKNFNTIFKEVENLAIAATDGGEPNLEVHLNRRIIRKSDITPEFTLRQNMLANCENMVEAFALYVNDALICATHTESDVFAALDSVKNQYNIGSLTHIDFLDNIAVRREFVPQTQILDVDGIINALNGRSQHREIYTVPEPEELANIATRFGMDLAVLQDMNKNLTEVVDRGVKVNVLKTQSIIRVQTEVVEKYNQEIGYDIVVEEDPEIPKGLRTIIKEGKVGSALMTAKVVRINGQEHERIQISEQVTKQPQTETVRLGTNASLPTTVSSVGWIWPSSGPITSQMGARWGSKHEGIDIGSAYGANVRAAMGGKVTLAGWNGDYGNCIRINSGDGFVEIYAHLSEINVKEGQTVAQGELIGKVGNTGRSTGPHLHFEIRHNNVAVDPLPYLPKR